MRADKEFFRSTLVRSHADRRQPSLDQLRPSRDRNIAAPESKRMPTLRIQVHLRRNPGILRSTLAAIPLCSAHRWR